MTKLNVIDLKGSKVKDININDEIWNIETNDVVLKKAIKTLTEKVAKGLAKKAGSALAKITAKISAGIASGGIITAGFVIYDFTTGMADARNILQTYG